jgi:hypothetical protein
MTGKLKITKNKELLDQFRNIIFSIETFVPEIISEDGEYSLEEYTAWHKSAVKHIQSLAAWKRQVDDYIIKGVDGDERKC